MSNPEPDRIIVQENPPPGAALEEAPAGFSADIAQMFADEGHIPVVVTVYERTDVVSTTLYEPND